MLALAHDTVLDAEQFAQLVLPEDPIPACDAIVAVGHPFSYLADEQAIDRAFVPRPRRSTRTGCSPLTFVTWSGEQLAETPLILAAWPRIGP